MKNKLLEELYEEIKFEYKMSEEEIKEIIDNIKQEFGK